MKNLCRNFTNLLFNSRFIFQEAPKVTPKTDAQNTMDSIMEGLLTADEQKEQDRTLYTFVTIKGKEVQFTFVGKTKKESETQKADFDKRVLDGDSPYKAYDIATGSVEKIKKLSERQIKTALKLITRFNGAKLAKLLGYKNCQQAIDSSTTLTKKFIKMGFKPHDAENAYKVIFDGAGTHTIHSKPVTQMARRKIDPITLWTEENYARTKMSPKELAQLKAKEAKKREEEEKIASAKMADDLF